MAATPDSIWQVPAYLPYLQPPLTNKAIATAEREVGYKLPTEYLDLLRKQNGGYIRYSLPEMVHRLISGIGPHFPSLTERDLEDGQEYVSFPLQGLIPFDGDGHWYICLDYRRNATTPCVTYVDIECDRQSEIADSFAGYLAMLEIDVGDAYVLENAGDIEQVKTQLSNALAVNFNPPESWAHGYPVHHADLGNEVMPQSIWISSNMVPRGFIRPNEHRYAELKDLMPGQAARYPEVPADAYILSASDGVLSRVVRASCESGFTVRPLRDYFGR